MKLTSTAFEHNGKIPSKYTCDGENAVTPLTVSDVPENAKSLVLIMDDPDIPDFVKEKYSIDKYDHWVLFNIKPDVSTIDANTAGMHGKNSGGNNAYTGPCPPDREHRYVYKLYALDVELDLPEGSSKQQVLDAIQGHVLAEAELIGRYERQQ